MSPGESVLRFLGTGLLNTAFGYGVYALLIIAGAPVWAAVGGATVLGVLFNFFSYGELVFGPSSPGRLPAFIAVYAVLYGLNVALANLLLGAGFGALLSQALLLPFLAALAYVLMRFFVFGKQPNPGWRRARSQSDRERTGRGQP